MVNWSCAAVIALLVLAQPISGRSGKKGRGSDKYRKVCASFNAFGSTIEIVRQGNEISVEGPVRFFGNQESQFTERHIDLSEECQRGIIYKSVFITFNPGGHPPLDFYGGGYGVPHWDAHFFTVSVAEVGPGGDHDLTSCDVTGPVPIQCDIASQDPRNVAFLRAPPDDYVPSEFQLDPQFGGHSIIGHGTHWLPVEDMAEGGPGSYTINGNTESTWNGQPGWTACAAQQPLVQPGGQLGQPGENGCRYGYWPGWSNVFITHGGRVLAHEPMFRADLVTNMLSVLGPESVARVAKKYPQAKKIEFKGASAEESFVEVINDEIEPLARIGLVLGGKSSKKGKGAALGSSLTQSDAFVPTVTAAGVAFIAIVAFATYRSRRRTGEYETLEYAVPEI